MSESANWLTPVFIQSLVVTLGFVIFVYCSARLALAYIYWKDLLPITSPEIKRERLIDVFIWLFIDVTLLTCIALVLFY